MTGRSGADLLSAADRYELDERAGILEFEAGLPRSEAEIKAAMQISRRRLATAGRQHELGWKEPAA